MAVWLRQCVAVRVVAVADCGSKNCVVEATTGGCETYSGPVASIDCKCSTNPALHHFGHMMQSITSYSVYTPRYLIPPKAHRQKADNPAVSCAKIAGIIFLNI